jgi:hypothetical protein
MTRTAITKLTATALAVASLGLATTAQAAEQNIAIGEPAPSGAPTQPQQPTGGDGDYHGPEDGSQAGGTHTERPRTCKELQEMGYKVHCFPKRPKCKYHYPRCPHPEKPHPGKPYPKPYPKPDYEKPVYKEPKPVTSKTAEPSKGSLPFTGLEIWQLGLIGIVLVGGGVGARRLLAS